MFEQRAKFSFFSIGDIMEFSPCVIAHRPADGRVDHDLWSWCDCENNYTGGSFRSLEECLDNAYCRGFKPRKEGEVLEWEDYWRWAYDNFTLKKPGDTFEKSFGSYF